MGRWIRCGGGGWTTYQLESVYFNYGFVHLVEGGDLRLTPAGISQSWNLRTSLGAIRLRRLETP